MDYTIILQDTLEIARNAGSLLLDYASRPIQQSTKASDIDIVTEADKAAEKQIVAVLLEKYPDFHIIGEEGGEMGAAAESAEYFWHVDPIDGTTNFANHFPYFCVSIGVSDREMTPLLGVVYDPSHDEMFYATRGQGAFLNEKRLHISSSETLKQSVLTTGFPYDRASNHNNNLEQWNAFHMQCRGVRCLGAAALDLCNVAAGRLEGYWEKGINSWDVLAGALIVMEAGGRVTNYRGDLSSNIFVERECVASNGHIHAAMLSLLNGKSG